MVRYVALVRAGQKLWEVEPAVEWVFLGEVKRSRWVVTSRWVGEWGELEVALFPATEAGLTLTYAALVVVEDGDEETALREAGYLTAPTL